MEKKYLADVSITLSNGNFRADNRLSQRPDESDQNFIGRISVVLEFMRARHGAGQ